MSPPRTFFSYLFNPFAFIAGGKSLALGAMMTSLAAWIGSFSYSHFDGVLDMHTAPFPCALWIYFAEVGIDWVSICLCFLTLAALFGKTKFRIIDVVGTQALARWPTVVTALMCLAPGYQRFCIELEKIILHPESAAKNINVMDATVFGLVTFGGLIMTGFMVYLMYRAFSISVNLRGGRAIGLFIGGLLTAELISKIAVAQLGRFI